MLLPYDVWVWCLMLPLRPRFLLNLQTSPMMPWDWLTTRGAPDTVNQIPSPLMMLVATLVTAVSIYGSGSRTSISPSCNAATDTDTDTRAPLPSLLLTWPVATPCNCNNVICTAHCCSTGVSVTDEWWESRLVMSGIEYRLRLIIIFVVIIF